ncbi:head GIN domain-containing protein [Gillisia sp. JM1]|uniref:head GIN domain-containing protein n=1 Tax=Gillisia sp. JM1 TaxID=1283286 RepID=UPI0003FF6F8A|nr:head GIN domain-containing protein [Gillisia sp. JM1]
MKKQFCFIFFVCLAYISVAQKTEKIKGDKEVISVSNFIDKEFSILEINNNLKVTLIQSKKNSYVLTTDQNLADVVSIEVKNGILKLHTTAKITGSKKLEIVLSVKGISTIILNDDAELETKGTLSSDLFSFTGNESTKFDLDIESKNASIILSKNSGGKINMKSKEATLNISDRSDLKLNLDANNLRAQLSKSAKLDMDGKVNNADFDLKNSAELKAKKMKARTATLNASNNTDIYIHVTKDLVIDAEGKSKVYVYGKPNIEVKGLTDKSRIIKK